MALQLLQRFHDHSHDRPDDCAVEQIETGQTLTWEQLAGASASVAHALSSQLAPGSAVILCCGNVPGFTVAFLGILRAGMRAFPIPEQSSATEFEAAAYASEAAGVLAFAPVLVALPALVLTKFDLSNVSAHPHFQDVAGGALLLNSSGTTGVPKVVLRSGTSLDAVSSAMCGAIGFTSSDRVLATVPLCHSYGIEHGLLAPIWAGSAVLLCRGFNLPAVVGALRERATIFPAVPFMLEAVSQEIGRCAMLRKVYSAGGALPIEVASRFANRRGLQVGQVYGATEIGSVTYADPDRPDYEPKSVGRAMQGVQITIAATGEVRVRAKSMLDGYLDRGTLHNPRDADGFFLTGDLGSLNPCGNLLLSGRSKLLIDVGGLKVNPQEVEAVLQQHPHVLACVVLPMRLSDTVTRLKALIVARDGVNLDTMALREHAKMHLSPHKLPRVFEVRPSLPMSAAGKVLRQQLLD